MLEQEVRVYSVITCALLGDGALVWWSLEVAGCNLGQQRKLRRACIEEEEGGVGRGEAVTVLAVLLWQLSRGFSCSSPR